LREGRAHRGAVARAAKLHLEETAPYKRAKQPEQAPALDSVLENCARTVAQIAVLAAVPPRYRGNRLGNGGIASPRCPGARPAGGPRGAGSGGAAGPEASHPVPQAPARARITARTSVICVTFDRVDAFPRQPWLASDTW